MNKVSIDDQGTLQLCGRATSIESLRRELGRRHVVHRWTARGAGGAIVEHWRIRSIDSCEDLQVRRIRFNGDVWHEEENAVVSVD